MEYVEFVLATLTFCFIAAALGLRVGELVWRVFGENKN